MSQTADVLLMHEAPHRRTVDELVEAIESRDPEIDIAGAESYDESRRRIADAEVVVTRSLPDEFLAEASELRWVQALNAGVDHYDVEQMRERDVILTNASGVHAIPAAEQVVGYMLQFERNLLRGFRRQQRHEWRHFGGGELYGSTLGVVGVGEIGGTVADRASAFGMQTLGVRRSPERGHESVDDMYGLEDLHGVLSRSDYVVLACPLTDDTRGLIGPRAFESMRSDGVLINVARGGVVDEDALVVALQKGKIGGAALDVQSEEPLPDDSPLWTQSNVILTPHMAGSTPRYLERCADIFVANFERYGSGDYDDFENRIV